MSSPRSDFALLLAAPDPVEADLARELLESSGIPSLLHGQDRDLAELGSAIHGRVARPDLLVPKSALERARVLLREAWDKSSLTDEIALATPREVEPERGSGDIWSGSRLYWVLGGAILALVLFLTWWRGLELGHPRH